ncbi:MAG: hypothetical protein C0604_05510, partial [Clostridiales bacterium]
MIRVYLVLAIAILAIILFSKNINFISRMTSLSMSVLTASSLGLYSHVENNEMLSLFNGIFAV